MSAFATLALFAEQDPETVRCDPPSERLVEGRPEAWAQVHYETPDERVSIGTWSCGVGRWRVAYDETEYCRILSGSGIVFAADGKSRFVKTGDEFVIPAGFQGEWQVLEPLSKRFVIVT